MPKIAGVNVLGGLLAAVAMFFIGFVWYGLLFTLPWMEANGLFLSGEGESAVMQWLTAEGVQSSAGGPDPMIMLAGFVQSLVLCFGLGWFMKQKGVTGLSAAVTYGLGLSLLIGVPLAAYDTIYTPWHSIAGLLVDGSHTVVTFVVACAIMSRFD